MFPFLSPEDTLRLQVFIFEKINEKCGRDLEAAIRQWWDGTRRVPTAPLSHTEQRMLARAAQSVASSYGRTVKFQEICKEVIKDAKEFIKNLEQDDDFCDPSQALNQSWSHFDDAEIKKHSEVIMDKGESAENKAASLRYLLSTNSGFVRKPTTKFMNAVMKLTQPHCNEVMCLLSKFFLTHDPEMVAIAFTTIVKFVFSKDFLDIKAEDKLSMVQYLRKCLTSLPSLFGRFPTESLVAMLVVLLEHANVNHEGMLLLFLVDPECHWFTLWWACMGLRCEMEEEVWKWVIREAEKMREDVPLPVYINNYSRSEATSSFLSLVSTLLSFSSLTQHRKYLLSLLTPAEKQSLALSLSLNSVSLPGLLKFCDDAYLTFIFQNIRERSNLFPKHLVKEVDKRLGTVHSTEFEIILDSVENDDDDGV